MASTRRATARRGAWAIVTIPVVVVLVVFAVANRGEATVSLWPMPIDISVPVFLLALGSLAIGLFIGALLFWIPLTRWRARARKREKRIAELEATLDERAKLKASDAATPVVQP